MLVGRGRFAKPTVICDYHQQLRSTFDETADEIGKEALIANGRRDPVSIERGDCIFRSLNEVTDLAGDAFGKGQQAPEWNVVAKRQKAHLVISRHLNAVGHQESGAVGWAFANS